ncbi:hypothetical protein MGYG_09166 [Nannizzia gypsea CBS 118893]|uniref:Uncharacterized protein n=1 Tax=Arthroderma gypseum (strain ATCC MYA-4604 / CBS 118893) TaxID=535722 RepID=E4V3W0_ARTGP|nr:hypothetical protein MGYG_09166 [Nannizzia gypsea CBS 118893]EFR04684.1 hypothetical protein MGYG_09166 [Nannizzia gypsea CBS 118893]
MHRNMHYGSHSSPRQSLEDMPMPGNFPDTPDLDDFEDLDNHFNKINLDNSLPRGSQLNESTYEGWTLYRGEPKTPGGERTWATAAICKMPLPQAELIDLIHKQKRQSVTEAYNELTLVKRQHIDNLIEQRKQVCKDPNYDWICVYINSATRDVRATFGPKKALTISISIVLCRQLKPEILRARRAAQILKEKKARNTVKHHKNTAREEFADPLLPSFHRSGLGNRVNHAPPPNFDPRMMGEMPLQRGFPPDHGRGSPPDEFRPDPHYPQQLMQPEMLQVAPGQHQQGQKMLPEMIQIPPPPIGPHQSQPRLLPALQNDHPGSQYHQLPPQGSNQGPMPSNQHHTGLRERPQGTQAHNQGPFNPHQHHSGHEEAYNDARVANQGPKKSQRQRSQQRPDDIPDIQAMNRGYQHRGQGHVRQEEPLVGIQEPKQKQRKQKKLPPKIVNSEKDRRKQEMVENWLEEESDPSDYDSYLFDPENASSVTDDSFSFGEYDNCDYPPDDEVRHRRSNKNYSREKSKSSERSGYGKQRYSLGYRTHVRPSERTSYLTELPSSRGPQYLSESIEILPSSSTHNRPGKLVRSETVSYPSRRHTLYPRERDLRTHNRGPRPTHSSSFETAWDLELREKERAHQRYLDSQQLSIEREVEARLLAESLARDSPDPGQTAQLEGYTPQRVLDTYEKYDRMKRLDGNRRRSYIDQPLPRTYPKEYLPSHEHPFRR